MEKCNFKLEYANCLTVDCVGHSGGLAMLWKKHVNLSMLNYSKSQIDAMMIDDTKKSGSLRVSMAISIQLRGDTWNLIQALWRGEN